MISFYLVRQHCILSIFPSSRSELSCLSWVPSHSDLFLILKFTIASSVILRLTLVLSLSQRSPRPITEVLFYCQWLVILLLSLVRNPCFQYRLIFVAAVWDLSNHNNFESVCMIKLELQIQNTNSIPSFNTLQQNKTISKYLENIFALLNCICNFNWCHL